MPARIDQDTRKGKSERTGRIAVRKCLRCGARVAAHGGRWLCDRCRIRRRLDGRGVRDSWLEISGHL